MDVTFGHVKIFSQLPQLRAAILEGFLEILRRQKMLGHPPVGPIFTALNKLKRAVYLVERAGGGVTQFVAANAPQQPGGMDFRKIQEDRVKAAIPHRGPGLGTAGEGDHVHLIGFAVIIKIRNLKHC